MLKQRVITALVLVAILLPTLLVDAVWPFSLLSLVFIAAAAWEWSRLNDAPGIRAWLMAAAVIGGCVYFAQVLGLPIWASGARVVPAQFWLLIGVVWVLGGAVVLRWGSEYWKSAPEWPRRLLGLAILVAAWLALIVIKSWGGNFMLSVLCLVWAADIGAYFGGRAFGKRKLAPSISPGKSWEGVWSGMVAVLILACAWMWFDSHQTIASPSLYTQLLNGLGPLGFVVAIASLCGMSVVGDLFESLVKRQAGAKDSSQLLPGHGGVLDRIDALLPVLPFSLALVTLCHA